MIGQFPWDPFPLKVPPPKGPDPFHAAAYRAAVQSADAYRGVREALRVEADLLRIGNRFVPLSRYREIAFVSLGVAAGSMALAALHILGDSLVAGFVAGPGPGPSKEEVPFQRLEVPTGLPGSPKAEEVVRGVSELAEGMRDDQLLLLLLSPGALGALTMPPHGMTPSDFRDFLEEAVRRGATGHEVERIARALGEGGVGGGVGRICPHADLATFLVERGEGGALLGGGPVHPVTDGERSIVREALARLEILPRLPRTVQDRLSPGGGIAGSASPPVHRPVYIARPSDALEGAGNDLFERKWRVRLAMLSLHAPPEEAADRFAHRVEEILANEREPGVDRSKGVAVLAATDLGLVEGVEEGPAQSRFLERADHALRRPDLSIGLYRTAGPLGGSGFPGGAVVGPPTNTEFAWARGRARAIPMETGVTDVGCVAVALRSFPEGPGSG